MEYLEKSPVVANIMNVGSDDDRRTIWEMNLPDGRDQMFVIKKDAKALGNHYHKLMSETFIFTTGGGTILTQALNEHGKAAEKIVKHVVTPGFRIELPAFTAHRFDLEGGTTFVCHASRPYDGSTEESKDLNPFPLPDPSEVED